MGKIILIVLFSLLLTPALAAANKRIARISGMWSAIS